MEYGNGGSKESRSGGKRRQASDYCNFWNLDSGDFLPIQLVYQEKRQPSVCHHLIFHQAGTLLLVTSIGVMNN